MTKTFLFGLSPSTGISAFQSTESLYDAVGNTGNLAFTYAISRQVGAANRHVRWNAPSADLKAAGDLAVMTAANQLGPHADLAKVAEKLASTDQKLVVLGLGAQSTIDGAIPDLPQGTLDFLAEARRHAPASGPNITVRGPFTKKVLDHYGFGDCAEVMGCPSLFINPNPRLGQLIARNLRRPQRIAVAAGSYTRPNHREVERKLVQLVTQTSGSYVGQHPLQMVQLTRGEAKRLSSADLGKSRDYLMPDASLPRFIRWTRRHGNVFFDIPSWMEHYRHFDLVTGMRIHGVMVALQAGVPALCIVHDSRTLELCETMMVPHVRADALPENLSPQAMMDLVRFDAAAFDANRQRLAGRYADFLGANGIQVPAWLRQIAAGTRK